MTFDKTKTLGTSNGKQPAMFGHMDVGNERSTSRTYLRRAFGNMKLKGLNHSPMLYPNNILGPFRTSFNAGDVITNNIESTNPIFGRPPNQVGGNNLAKLGIKGDGVSANGRAMFSGNPKYVSDGSDYIRFKKLQAINKTYNDHSYGGKSNSLVFSVLNKVR
jgi:hypothetical protein